MAAKQMILERMKSSRQHSSGQTKKAEGGPAALKA
jgi:hypothetical protein